MIELSSEFQNYFKQNSSGIRIGSAKSVLELVEEGATVPFIARYRKEKTGNLDEVQIREVVHIHQKWSEVTQRKKFVVDEIEKQGNLTPELKKQIENSFDLAEIEELYRPFKRKKKTKAKMAKDAGLAPIADWIWRVGHGDLKDSTSLEVKAKDYLNPAAGFATYEEVLRGAQHIIVEKLYTDADLRTKVREDFFKNGHVVTKAGKKYKANSKFEKYSDYKEAVTSLENPKASHRYLAIRRGWQEGELTVNIEGSHDDLLKAFEKEAVSVFASQVNDFLSACAKIALDVHVIPSVINELHRKLKDKADHFAIQVFAENLRRVLMGSPFGAKVVLGVDPGIRTGCKLALVDAAGKYISDTVIYLDNDDKKSQAKKLFSDVFSQIKIDIVAIGNGTGGRETETFVRDTLKELGRDIPVVMVNEAGASVYSASDVAREEFPSLDVTVRGAISIARRLQDPLAELVKVDPKSIGVGQYQHDVSQTDLKNSLFEVVESCVNQVGVNVNTASPSLLQYVAGIGPAIAKKVVDYRQSKGLFLSRKDLFNIDNFSQKTFEQAAGFLRVPNSKEVLDRTGIHPESYPAVKEMAAELGVEIESLLQSGAEQIRTLKEKYASKVGEFTFDDIVSELKKPGRDPRDPYKVFKFRDDIHEIKDLKKEMICPGIVTNVTNFGAFVDIGVHQDGLVHLSQISREFVDDPKSVVSPGDQVTVKVLNADLDKNQISLSMLVGEKPAVRPRPSKDKKSGPRRESGQNKKASGKKRQDHRKGSKRSKQRVSEQQQKGGQRKPKSAPFNNPFAALSNIGKDS